MKPFPSAGSIPDTSQMDSRSNGEQLGSVRFEKTGGVCPDGTVEKRETNQNKQNHERRTERWCGAVFPPSTSLMTSLIYSNLCLCRIIFSMWHEGFPLRCWSVRIRDGTIHPVRTETGGTVLVRNIKAHWVFPTDQLIRTIGLNAIIIKLLKWEEKEADTKQRGGRSVMTSPFLTSFSYFRCRLQITYGLF